MISNGVNHLLMIRRLMNSVNSLIVLFPGVVFALSVRFRFARALSSGRSTCVPERLQAGINQAFVNYCRTY